MTQVLEDIVIVQIFMVIHFPKIIIETQEVDEKQLMDEESSDIDENFYDALSDYDKNLFTMIKGIRE